eukprot:5227033-Prymnesium_polylepis.1
MSATRGLKRLQPLAGGAEPDPGAAHWQGGRTELAPRLAKRGTARVVCNRAACCQPASRGWQHAAAHGPLDAPALPSRPPAVGPQLLAASAVARRVPLRGFTLQALPRISSLNRTCYRPHRVVMRTPRLTRGVASFWSQCAERRAQL